MILNLIQSVATFLIVKVPLAVLGVLLGIPIVLLSYYSTDIPEILHDRTLPSDWRYRRLPWGLDRIWGNMKYGADGNWFWKEEVMDSRPDTIVSMNNSDILMIRTLSRWFWYDHLSVIGRYKWLFIRNTVSGIAYTNLLSTLYVPNEVTQTGPDVDDNLGIEGLQITEYQGKYGLYWVKKRGDGTTWWKAKVGYKFKKGIDSEVKRAKLTVSFGISNL